MKNRFRSLTASLYFRIVLLAIVTIILPIFIMFIYFKSGYEKFIQNEVGENISQQIQESKNDLDEIFYSMVKLSNSFLADENLKKIYVPEKYQHLSYYDKVKIFDRYLSNISIYQSTDLQDVKVTFLDSGGTMYANWSMAYKDYSFLFDKNWIKRGIQEYELTWNLFTDEFIGNPQGKRYVSMVRPVVSESDPTQIMGILYISLCNDAMDAILAKYLYSENDHVGIYEKNGTPLIGENKILSANQVRELLGKKSNQERFSDVLLLDGKKYLVNGFSFNNYFSENDEQKVLIYLTDFQKVNNKFLEITKRMNSVLMLFTLIIIVLLLLFSYRFVNPIKNLSIKMQQYQPGKEVENLDVRRNDVSVGRN